MANATEELRRAILGRNPLIFVKSWEEDRAIRLLEAFASKLFPQDPTVVTWSCVSGLSDAPEEADTKEPVAAIAGVIDRPDRGFYVFKDLSAFLDDPAVVRALREAYYALRGSEKYLILLSPELALPESLRKEMLLVDLGLPEEGELDGLARAIAKSYPQVEMDEALFEEVAFGLKGLTLNEATHTLHRIFRGKRTLREEALEEVFEDKEQVVRKFGFLEYVRPDARIEDIGGLDNLKQWLLERKAIFSRQAVADEVPTPKGMLIMGISGCGKSFAAKAVSSLWGVPLFRLEMSRVFSGAYGAPEAAFNTALSTMEALAPAILWIDEIENGLGMDEHREGAVSNSQIFSAFLTWMQEKPPLIFVAATANRIQALPAEFIRKGRFDQIYFVDLPNDEERSEIFRIHLERHGADLEQFDLHLLTVATKGWNGAEIEQAVIAARIQAYHEGRPFTIDDLAQSTSTFVPLSRTMEEQVKRIRNWAMARATPASKYGKSFR